MMGNQINLYIKGGQQVPVGAALVCVLMVILLVLMVYYLVSTVRTARRMGT
jgi:ABC-type spermidine/putrescine transport system permease subunit I